MKKYCRYHAVDCMARTQRGATLRSHALLRWLAPVMFAASTVFTFYIVIILMLYYVVEAALRKGGDADLKFCVQVL